jgi:hypothetical protein
MYKHDYNYCWIPTTHKLAALGHTVQFEGHSEGVCSHTFSFVHRTYPDSQGQLRYDDAQY